jgi:DNA-binding CsgD family transcriptional regulator
MKSGHVRLRDWKALFHLAGDLADVPAADVEASLQLLLERLFAILGARGGFWVSGARIMNGRAAASDPLCGWRPAHVYDFDPEPDAKAMRQRWAAYAPNYLVDPHTQAVIRGHGRHRTFLRPELVDDRTWEGSVQVNEVLRPIGIGDRLVGAFNVTPAVEVFVGLDRSAGEKPFGVRKREVLRAALEKLGWFHRRVLRELELIEAAQTLTLRERQMLPLLLSGRPEKQIAGALGLTARTTHIYIANIYRKLRVHSRAELMSLWVQGRASEPLA